MNCPDCGSACWDNRADKRNPRSPDFKCKNKACGKGVWEEKPKGGESNGNGASSRTASAAAPPTRQSGGALAPLYLDCLDTANKAVRHIMGDTATSSDVIAAAATLFIQSAMTGRPIRTPKPAPAPAAPPPPPPPPPVYDPYENLGDLPF